MAALTAKEKVARDADNPLPKMDSLVTWRQEKVWELRSAGLSIDDIVEVLKGNNRNVKISHGTVCRDLKAKQAQVRESFKSYIEEELPLQHSLAVTGLDRVVKEAWRIFAKSSDPRVQLTALSTISDATMKKQAVLGDPAQIEKAIKLVAKIRVNLANQDKDAKEGHDSQGDFDVQKEVLPST